MAKMKVPKKVVGVKIPKKVRKRANKALKMADSPLVREAAVAALGAAGTAKGLKEAGNGRGRGDRGGPGRFDAEVLVEAIRDAALDGVRRFILGFEEGLRKAADAAGEAADAVEERAKGDAHAAPGAARPKPPRRTKRRPAKAAAAG